MTLWSGNVLYTLDHPKKRAVGFKRSDGMELPDKLATKFKFARQKSKLADTIRRSYFVVKGEYCHAAPTRIAGFPSTLRRP